MRHLDLFSGIGGFALAARWMGWETVGFCEREPFCQAVLRKHWPEAPIHDDITTMDAAGYAGRVDVVTAGFPCIDISSAGAKDGIYGADSGLWQHAARIIGDVRPRYIVMENVADLLYRGLGDVLGRLAALGYDAEWHCIPACYAGAPQPRDRCWVIAYPDGLGLKGRPQCHGAGPVMRGWNHDDGLALAQDRARAAPSTVRRMDDGLSRRLDSRPRLAALGNAIVPQVAYLIFQAIAAASPD